MREDDRTRARGAGPDPRPLADLVERWRMEERLIAEVPVAEATPGHVGPADIVIAAVRDDSRAVEAGDLFVALRGLSVDGHDFVAQAIDRGAVAVVVEEPFRELAVPQVVVRKGSAALASAAAWWYGDPSRELVTVGITGTNGKTTTSFLVQAALKGAGLRTGLVGTIGVDIDGDIRPNREPNTTPGALDLQRLLREMVNAGDQAVVLETSSHGLAADRVGSVDYDAAIFTNLSHEHLDFHKTFEAYRDAKLSLFTRLPRQAKGSRPGLAIVNADDGHAGAFADAAEGAGATVITYGEARDAGVRLLEFRPDPGMSRLRVGVGGNERSLDLRLPGRFNARNALATLALAHGWGLDLDAVVEALEAVPGVPGRMERIDAGQSFVVVIDFAHTPGSLEAILRELAPLAPDGGGVISVFGSSGERDVAKRPLMGEATARGSRLVIVTEDDSRNEDPGAIFEQIAAGAERAGKRRGEDLLIIPDRREAIAEAFRRAKPGDVVLLAGKGHETWNMGPNGPEPWSDRETALALLGKAHR
ncbi:MAG TPA: UDP-N-acetylmuramoyl-L-alanyl-D-glutamate--2,6-diaminopimelate ligase [Candidatus Limnocylindrales bacterium]|nr:UDP-N-acetylmuramoyl-L-alanyl-D-glutamate--2,6-diaminopimelate ligase [Candidatus Limnocylindrales bacterium]